MTNSHSFEDPAFSYEMSPPESPSEGVVAAVSAASGAEPLEAPDASTPDVLDPLYSAIDPDALNSLFCTTDSEESRTSCCVTFDYHGYEVTVHGDRITVERLESASD